MPRPADPEKRASILRAAREIFLRDGYKDARMAAIAAAAGVAPGTLYLYFESKQDLVIGLSNELYDKVAGRVVPLVVGLNSPEGVRKLVGAVVEACQEDRDVLTIARLAMAAMDGPRGWAKRQATLPAFAALMKAKMDEGIFIRYDPLPLADLVAAITQRLVLACLMWEQGDLSTYEETAVKLLQRVLFDAKEN